MDVTKLPPNEVSIPHWFDSKALPQDRLSVDLARFNSTLVRFKVREAFPLTLRKYRFNSTLVRFKGTPSKPAQDVKEPVSIPHWFDSKEYRQKQLPTAIPSFNSTLVRFKGVRSPLPARLGTVFQFHIGSIQSASICARSSALSVVSIPHWFDSKCPLRADRLHLQARFQFHIGSIQSVIRHFFLLACQLFQFHIGSIQRRTNLRRMWIEGGFNSTLVRFKVPHRHQLRFCVGVSIPHWFDSKAVESVFHESDNHVSIPHWFDSKIQFDAGILMSGTGFNSTLVRFKEGNLSRKGKLARWFQFHIGSIQRR